MLTTLAFDQVEISLYRQLLEPFTFPTTAPSQYQGSDLDSHIVALHQGGLPSFSQDIASDILTHQVGLGLSSDWLTDGSYMADVDVNSLYTVTDLTVNSLGGAWQYFSNDRVVWAEFRYNVQGVLKNYFWMNSSVSGSFQARYDGLPPFDENSELKIISYNMINSSDTSLRANSLPDVFSQVTGDIYVANPAFIIEETYIQILPNSTAYSRDPSHYFNADALPIDTPGLYDPSVLDLFPAVSQAEAHIQDFDVHKTVTTDYISFDSLYNSWYMRYSLQQYIYNGMGGDAWFNHLGVQSPIVNPSDNSHLVEGYELWLAYGINGGYVRDPGDNSIVAAPINNSDVVQCMFTMAPGVMPVADPLITLRKLNPGVGYQLIQPIV